MGDVAGALGLVAGAGGSVSLLGLVLMAVVVFWPDETPFRRLLALVRAWRRPRS